MPAEDELRRAAANLIGVAGIDKKITELRVKGNDGQSSCRQLSLLQLGDHHFTDPVFPVNEIIGNRGAVFPQIPRNHDIHGAMNGFPFQSRLFEGTIALAIGFLLLLVSFGDFLTDFIFDGILGHKLLMLTLFSLFFSFFCFVFVPNRI